MEESDRLVQNIDHMSECLREIKNNILKNSNEASTRSVMRFGQSATTPVTTRTVLGTQNCMQPVSDAQSNWIQPALDTNRNFTSTIPGVHKNVMPGFAHTHRNWMPSTSDTQQNWRSPSPEVQILSTVDTRRNLILENQEAAINGMYSTIEPQTSSRTHGISDRRKTLLKAILEAKRNKMRTDQGSQRNRIRNFADSQKNRIPHFSDIQRNRVQHSPETQRNPMSLVPETQRNCSNITQHIPSHWSKEFQFVKHFQAPKVLSWDTSSEPQLSTHEVSGPFHSVSGNGPRFDSYMINSREESSAIAQDLRIFNNCVSSESSVTEARSWPVWKSYPTNAQKEASAAITPYKVTSRLSSAPSLATRAVPDIYRNQSLAMNPEKEVPSIIAQDTITCNAQSLRAEVIPNTQRNHWKSYPISAQKNVSSTCIPNTSGLSSKPSSTRTVPFREFCDRSLAMNQQERVQSIIARDVVTSGASIHLSLKTKPRPNTYRNQSIRDRRPMNAQEASSAIKQNLIINGVSAVPLSSTKTVSGTQGNNYLRRKTLMKDLKQEPTTTKQDQVSRGVSVEASLTTGTARGKQRDYPVLRSFLMSENMVAPSHAQNSSYNGVSTESSITAQTFRNAHRNGHSGNSVAMNTQIKSPSFSNQNLVTCNLLDQWSSNTWSVPDENRNRNLSVERSHSKRIRSVPESEINRPFCYGFATNAPEEVTPSTTQIPISNPTPSMSPLTTRNGLSWDQFSERVHAGSNSSVTNVQESQPSIEDLIIFLSNEHLLNYSICDSYTSPISNTSEMNFDEALLALQVDLPRDDISTESDSTTSTVLKNSAKNARPVPGIKNGPSSLPVAKKTSHSIIDTPDDIICSICLDTSESNEMKHLPCCHAFHQECIDAWLKKSRICPLCREPADFLPGFPPFMREQPFFDYDLDV